jgi:hypothetical protein
LLRPFALVLVAARDGCAAAVGACRRLLLLLLVLLLLLSSAVAVGGFSLETPQTFP